MNPCSLVCEGEGQGVVYTFGKVTDGTHCKTSGQERDGLCVNGRCMVSVQTVYEVRNGLTRVLEGLGEDLGLTSVFGRV